MIKVDTSGQTDGGLSGDGRIGDFVVLCDRRYKGRRLHMPTYALSSNGRWAADK